MFILNDDVSEIPNKLVTVIPPEIDLSDNVSINFINKRKSNNSSITSLADKLKTQVDISSDLFEVHEIKNGLFKLEIGSPYRIYVSHPELPKRTFKFYMSVEPFRLTKLICDCGSVRSGVLGGEYYYDTRSKFFILNNDNEYLKKRVQFGEYLTHQEKLIPGNEYVIELKNACRRFIYLGEVEDCFLIDYLWVARKGYVCELLFRTPINEYFSSEYPRRYIIKKNRFGPLNLLKDNLDQYYLLPKKYLKNNKGGLIRENVASGMSEKEFQALCVQNNWIAGLNPLENREKMKELFKKKIIDVITENGSYYHIFSSTLDLSSLNSTNFSDRVINNISKPYSDGIDFYLRSIADSSIFSNVNEPEIRDFYRSIWLEQFGKE